MAVDVTPINDLLSTIADSFIAAKGALPENAHSFTPPADGISLLDVKNDLLLSYLQHLTFLILVRLQHASDPSSESVDLGKKVVKKLIELRAYLDRGVRPLEGRLRYQIDKVLRAAEDASRSSAQKAQAPSISTTKDKKKARSRRTENSDVSTTDGSEAEDDSDAVSAAQDTDDEEANTRPNPQAIAASVRARAASNTASANKYTSARDGLYKPPRVTATAMPASTRDRVADAEETRHARRRKNALLDEYVNEEHSSAPTAQPSIGSNNTILARGRQHTTLGSRDRDRERERTEYEERNFVRLPSVSKADKKKEKAMQAKSSRDMFGGEDWTGLGGLGDRIGRSVTGKDRGMSILDRREKRRRDTQDSPRGDGVGIGETFEKRRKVVQGRLDRRGGKRR